MHSLKPFTFTINLLLLLLSVSSQKPLVDADIDQVTLRDQSSLSLNNNNNSFECESNEEDILNNCPSIESNITPTEFTYLMKFGLQTYQDETGYRYVDATPDTGSDFIWFYSQPCNSLRDRDCSCFKNRECTKKPKNTIGCSDACEKLKNIGINHECYHQNHNGICWYKGIKYADKTESKGFYGRADFKFTIGQSDKTNGIDEKTFSVGFSTTTKDEKVPERNGLVGLGMGGLSLIRQYEGLPKKFSYYLPQFRRKDEQEIIKRSKFKFGCNVEIDNKKSTTLLSKQDKYPMCATRYCVELKSICLKFKGENCENHRIDTNEDDNHKVIVIDSGSTNTHLNEAIFQKFLKIVQEKLEVKSGKEMSGYDKCFEKKEVNVEKLENISFQFGGTKIELKKENFFDEYSVAERNGDLKNYVCLTVQANKKEVKIQTLGSRAQMDFTVAFDLGRAKKVSFVNHENLPHAGSVERVSFENNEKN